MPIIVNGKLQKNRSYSGVKTVTRTIRAEKSFFDLCDKVAQEKGVTRNDLVIMVLFEYLKENGNG
jgi:predicted DNA-binding ribbon-helix-helix protein